MKIIAIIAALSLSVLASTTYAAEINTKSADFCKFKSCMVDGDGGRVIIIY